MHNTELIDLLNCNITATLVDKLSRIAISQYRYSSAHFRFTLSVKAFNSLFNTDYGIPQCLLWEKQRKIDSDKVGKIIENLEIEDPSYRSVNMVITIATINNSDPKCIDGQHRCDALTKFDRDQIFDIIYIDFPNEEARFSHFRKINCNTPLPDYLKNADTINENYVKTAKNIWRVFAKNYPDLVGSKYYQIKEDEFNDILCRLLPNHVIVYELADSAEKFINALEHKSLHPSSPAGCYIHYRMDDGNCQAKVQTTGKRCENRSKSFIQRGSGGFNVCGKHTGIKTEMFSVHKYREDLYNSLKPKGLDFALIQGNAETQIRHYWIQLALNIAFPLINLDD